MIDEAGIVQFETKVTAEVECIVTSLPSSSGPLARAATDLGPGYNDLRYSAKSEIWAAVRPRDRFVL